MSEAETLQLAGAAVRFRDNGVAGPAVLMTHGIGGSLELWHRQFEPQPPSLRLIAWDLPSHGLSGALPDGADLDGMARQAWRLLDARGVDRVTLVGNSLGGAVSLRMAAQAPQRVQGLMLVAAATLGPDSPLPFRLMTLPGLGGLLARPGPIAVQQQVQAIVHRRAAISDALLAVIERNVMRPGASAHFLAVLRGITTVAGQKAAVLARSREILHSLQVPVHLVHGENDAVLPPAHSRRAHAERPHSRLEVLPDCGHTPQLEQPARFNALLEALVQEATGTGRSPPARPQGTPP